VWAAQEGHQSFWGSVDGGSSEDGASSAVQNSGIWMPIGVGAKTVVGCSKYEFVMLLAFSHLEECIHVYNVASGSALIAVGAGNKRSSVANASTGFVLVVDRSRPPVGLAAVSVGSGFSCYNAIWVFALNLGLYRVSLRSGSYGSVACCWLCGWSLLTSVQDV